MGGGVFLMQEGGGLLELRESKYDSETVLQELIASYPNLLAGDQIDTAEARRWLLVSREVSVPDMLDGAGRWSLDHLLLDQDGVPTLVEVKRATDTRIRREVVGQMLDYAANALAYWPAERVRSEFEARCEREGLDAPSALQEVIRTEEDAEEFWNRVKTNLKAGRLRLVFVADKIPPELQRIIEFLNGQMTSTEVLGVAIQQFAGSGQKMLVPRVVGRTAAAQQSKGNGSAPGREWNEESFLKELESKRGQREVAVASRVLEWARSRGLRDWWGQGRKSGSYFPILDCQGTPYSTVSLWTYGSIEIQFGMLRKLPPFEAEALRRDLQSRLNGIPGVAISEEGLTQRPPIRMSVLTGEPAQSAFVHILDWVVDTIQAEAGRH